MPIYEYECEACGNRFEQIQKFSDPLVEVCPKCGERKVHKLLSSPAIQFKGSGFYITDYAKKGSTGPESSKDPKESTESSKSAAAAKSGDQGSSDKGSSDKGSSDKGSSDRAASGSSSSSSGSSASSSSSSSTDTASSAAKTPEKSKN